MSSGLPKNVADVYVDPLSGELVAGSLTDLNASVDATWQEIERLKTAVAPLQARRAELRGPVRLPRRRDMTAKQAQICPSCGKPWEPSE